MHDGLRVSQACKSVFSFKHNSVEDLRQKLARISEDRPSIRSCQSSVFILVDAIYSMEGDIAPLKEITDAVKSLLPAGVGHVFVDE